MVESSTAGLGLIGSSIGPFRVLGKLGAGGMGDVYLAEDTRLGRKVALKSPTESWLRSPDARARLHREARAAARLNHPFIAAIYDVLDIDGCPYIVIEYVDGEPLSVLLRQGPLPVERALATAMQLCDALDAAHAAGVIHRDLKPANVMITSSGGLKVLDFGLARTSDAGGAQLTDAGQMLGTPDYMAPEQFVGRTANERTDIYSLGALLYELLTGERPFAAVDPLGRVLGHISAPPPLSARIAGVPAELDDVIARALALDPEHRYPSVRAMKLALERVSEGFAETHARARSTGRSRGRVHPWRRSVMTAAVVLVVLAAAVVYVQRWVHTPHERTDVPVVAVLPLRNDTGDAGDDYLRRAFSDSLVTGLASVRNLVLATQLLEDDTKGTGGDPKKVARATGARYVVDGSYQRSGARYKVNVRIFDASGAVAWARDFDEPAGDVFELQRRITLGVSEGLRVSLTPQDLERATVPATASEAAIRAYSEAHMWMERLSEPAATDRAVALFKQATDDDSNFALAFAGLGEALWQRYRLLKSPADGQAAIAATEHARTLQPDSPLIRLALAGSYHRTGRIEPALAELRAVLTLQPNNDDALRLRASIYAQQQKTNDAIADYQGAISIRPLYWRNHYALGLLYYETGRFPEAAIAYQRVVDLQPENGYAWMNLGAALQAAGNIPRAIEYYKRSIEVSPTARVYSNLGTIYYSQRRADDAVAAFEAAVRLSPSLPMLHRNLGDAYGLKGDRTSAAEAFRRCVDTATAHLPINPNDAATISTIAVCEAKLSRPAVARQWAQRAVQIAPEHAAVLFRAASVEALAGRQREALDLLERAIAHGYSRSFARESDELAGLRGEPRFVRLTAEPR